MYLKNRIMDKSLYTEYELQQLREYGYVKYKLKKYKNGKNNNSINNTNICNVNRNHIKTTVFVK